MEPIICSNCSAIQPKDWQAGNLCIQCGKAVRPEMRCAWCCKWSPQEKFCRECGTELIPQEYFGAARMLKNAGVDQFTLAERVRTLDTDQLKNFERLYQKHFSILLRLVKEVEYCEEYLVQKNHDQKLFEELIAFTPFNEDQLKKYQPVETDNLSDILKSSAIDATKTLAALALLRSGLLEGSETQQHECMQAAQSALQKSDARIALEAAFTLANWRMKLFPFPEWAQETDLQRIAELGTAVLDNPELQNWGAVCYWPLLEHQKNSFAENSPANLRNKVDENRIREYLKAGLHSSDPDLRFCCALSLQNENDLALYLDDQEVQKQYLAAGILALNKSLHLSKFLQNSKNKEQLVSILYVLKPPLPKPLQEALLQIIEKQPYQVMQRIFQLLEADWDENMERSLIQKAALHKEYDLFNLLVRSKKITNHDQAIDAYTELPFTEKTSKSFDSIKMQYRFPNFFLKKIGAIHDQKVDEILLDIAQEQIIKFQHPIFLQWIMDRVFCDERDKIQRDAVWVLIRCQKQADHFKPFIFTSQSIEKFFTIQFFLERLTLFLKNDNLLKEVGIYEWAADLLESFDLNFSLLRVPDNLLKNFLDALLNIITNDYWLFLRTAAVKCLGRGASKTSYKEKYSQELQSFVTHHELLFDLSETIKKTIEEM